MPSKKKAAKKAVAKPTPAEIVAKKAIAAIERWRVQWGARHAGVGLPVEVDERLAKKNASGAAAWREARRRKHAGLPSAEKLSQQAKIRAAKKEAA